MGARSIQAREPESQEITFAGHHGLSASGWSLREGRHWLPVPDWAERLSDLGTFVADRSTDPLRMTTTVSLPTVHYGATFVALGAVQALARVAEKPSLASHAAYLKGLPPNSPVTLIDQDRAKDGYLEEIRQINGSMTFFVRYGKTKRAGIPESLCQRIQPCKKESVRLHKNSKGRDVVQNRSFLEAVLPDADVEVLQSISRPWIAVIGEKGRLTKELSTEVRVRTEDRVETGTLAEATQASTFMRDYKVLIHSDQTKTLDLGAFDVVILASAIAFLRFGRSARTAQRIVLLDRCEAQFGDAVAEFNRAALHEQERAVEALPRLPAASEAAAYLAPAG